MNENAALISKYSSNYLHEKIISIILNCDSWHYLAVKNHSYSKKIISKRVII